MAFITLEDMVGSVEVIVFPKTYEANAPRLNADSKVFIEGRVSVEVDRDAKLIASKITMFEEIPRTVWIRFANLDEYSINEGKLFSMLSESDGNDNVTLYLTETKQVKKLGKGYTIKADKNMIDALSDSFGKENVQVV